MLNRGRMLWLLRAPHNRAGDCWTVSVWWITLENGCCEHQLASRCYNSLVWLAMVVLWGSQTGTSVWLPRPHSSQYHFIQLSPGIRRGIVLHTSQGSPLTVQLTATNSLVIKSNSHRGPRLIISFTRTINLMALCQVAKGFH